MATQVTRPDHLIDLAVGQPEPELLPVDLFRSLSVEQQDLAYGEQAGNETFRKLLSAWLSEDYDQPVNGEQLFLTNGSSNALDMICSQLSKPGATILVEDPSYFIALKLFKEHGFNVVALPMDEDGVVLQALEQAIHSYQPAFFYTISSFHNPSGITQSHSRRQGIVKLAVQTQCPVVADDVYQSLYFGKKPPAPLACYDHNAPILSIGSFSKILAPGLRLGWIQGSGDIFHRLKNSALLQSGGGLAPVTSALVGPLIANGNFQKNLEYLRQSYTARSEVLFDGLVSTIGDQISINKPNGGYFLWVTFVDGRDVASKLHEARQAGVSYLPGKICSVNGHFLSSMRLCFAWYSQQQLMTACGRLASVFS